MKARHILIAGTAAALLPLTGAFAQSSPPAQDPTEGQQQGATFESLDTNSDGRISKSEAMANQSVSEQFSKYDQNGDGFIERSEVNSANQSSGGEQPQ